MCERKKNRKFSEISGSEISNNYRPIPAKRLANSLRESYTNEVICKAKFMNDENGCGELSKSMGSNILRDQLYGASLEHDQIDFIIENKVKFIDRPRLLSRKLRISEDNATSVLEILKSFEQDQVEKISQEHQKIIENTLEENPDFDSIEDIAMLSNIDERIVSVYFESRPINEQQKSVIKTKYYAGYRVGDIADLLKLSAEKVQRYVEGNLLSFSGKEGSKILNIIQKHFGDIPSIKLRENIISKDLKLQDQLCCILQRSDGDEYMEIKNYFKKFEESKSFFELDKELTLKDISYIDKHCNDSVEQLSLRLQKVESVIIDYLNQYDATETNRKFIETSQKQQINLIKLHFCNEELTFHSYRMIIANTFEDMMEDAGVSGKTPNEIFKEFLPLAFYYLKCSLPLEDITQIFANTSKVSLTTHEVFHIIFQLSDPVLRGFCLEHYSFSNPVPFYYPKLHFSDANKRKCARFGISKELWYSLQAFNGLISYGLGRAGWNPVGKSYLLDLIFGTDFVAGSPSKSAFHSSSIDIQMTKNLFGELKEEAIKWGFIDCHGFSDFKVIQNISQLLEIALIHVTHHDFIRNKERLDREISISVGSVKYVYVFVRDCDGVNVKIDRDTFDGLQTIYIPNLTNTDINIHSVKKSLREIGYEILHLNLDKSKSINGEFLEKLLSKLDNFSSQEIESDKRLITKISSLVYTSMSTPSAINFSFLNYYPLFVEYMSCYYRACHEPKQTIIDSMNARCDELQQKLLDAPMCEIVSFFNQIIEKQNSALIMWKLSQELSLLSKKFCVSKQLQQKNDKYTLEILWREAVLYNKYGSLGKEDNHLKKTFALSYSNHVRRGEAFELIDGDNLRFFNKEIDALLSDLYEEQNKELEIINRGSNDLMKQAPIVMSIFGPQSSGKSTLLNYCFGCKFLTSAGRCTRGIYGSLCRLSRPVNCTNQFLILDTEGLDAIERKNIEDTSSIHFDRTMVLFCLAVSQVVIINIKGDIGSELQNLLQICAYSLHKLKVRRVPAPKIFFVLNQQADPDPKKHLDSINILMEKMNKESALMDTEGIKMSELIQISRENLFILPSAFNSESMNKPNSKLFDTNVIKLTPTVSFAEKCTNLRLAVIDQLDNLPEGNRAPFQTMSDWIQMSGTIWDTIIKFQDIVKYGNIEELQCNNLLSKTISKLMDTHMYQNKKQFDNLTKQLTLEINSIKSESSPDIILSKIMMKFDEVFEKYRNVCVAEYGRKCQNEPLLRKMDYICVESKANMSRLLYMVRKEYEDSIKFQIKAVLTEIKLSESMKRFQEMVIGNVDRYLELTVEQQSHAFEETWLQCFGMEDQEDEVIERDENFCDLYSRFRIESMEIESQATIYELFRSHNFDMDKIVNYIRLDISARFRLKPSKIKTTEEFIYPTNVNDISIKDMKPYPGRESFEYFDGNQIFSLYRKQGKEYMKFTEWVPKKCIPLVQLCSGHFNHPDIICKDKHKQICLLSSCLRSPKCTKKNTWSILVDKIFSNALFIIEKDPIVSSTTVREIIDSVSRTLKIVNHEISYIQAKLSITAERTISTFVFAIAFRSLWNIKKNKPLEYQRKKDEKKSNYRHYFLQKIENRKMVRGGWNRERMKDSDHQIAKKFASDFISAVERGILNIFKSSFENLFRERKDSLSHESIFFLANSLITKEISKSDEEILDTRNFVVQFICNRNESMKRIFDDLWCQANDEVYRVIAQEMKAEFTKQITNLIQVLKMLLRDLTDSSIKSGHPVEKASDSDSNFEIVSMIEGKGNENQKLLEKEGPFKAMVTYLKMYLDPNVNPAHFQNFFSDIFKIEGKKIQKSDTYILCDKPSIPRLDEDTFRKLENTKMFSNENIYNIYEYATAFLQVLGSSRYTISPEEFANMVQNIKDDYKKEVLGCPSQCPSCGKLCEKKIHPRNERCHIKTGHQICSMGGKVWNNDLKRTAVLFMCDDYKDYTKVTLQGRTTTWGQFKEKLATEWEWKLPREEKYATLQAHNQDKMIRIWNKFGRAILKYYADEEDGPAITYIPYTSFDEVYKNFSLRYNICFVIDGTGSMHREIQKARISVQQFISKYQEQGKESQFKVVIYRDHCDDNIIEMCPKGETFTTDHVKIQNFLETVKATGGGDFPEAALDGLATASSKCKWNVSSGYRNLIIHIFDAPPHGDFPNYKQHNHNSDRKNCCCCNHGSICRFDWDKDVWEKMETHQIQYHAINTGKRSSPKFTDTMKRNLGELYGNLQEVGREVVNDAILRIFIDYKKDL